MRLSIIIPIYNAEKYLSHCLESILAHNYIHDYEIVCVNDGSTDSSVSILKDFSRQYSNMRIITQKNSGVSSARNKGIENASGDRIMFVDADDVILPDTLERFLISAEHSDVDLSIASLRRTSRNGLCSDTILKDKIYANYCGELMIDTDNLVIGSPCFKIYKKSIIDHYKLLYDKNMPLYEDACFVYDYMRHCNKISTSSIVLYEYLVNDESATAKYRDVECWAYLKKYVDTQLLCAKTLNLKNDHLDLLLNKINETVAYMGLFNIYNIFRAYNRPRHQQYDIFRIHLSEYKVFMAEDALRAGIPYIFKKSLNIHPLAAYCFLKTVFFTDRIVKKLREHK